MSSIPKPLALYDLLATHFSLGFSFPDYIDHYLSLLSVSEFQATSDPNGILYTGTVYFPTSALPQHQDPNGAIFDFHDISFRFRLLFPRTGADIISSALSKVPALIFPPSLEPLRDNAFGASASPPSGPTDFPGVAFQLELLLNLVTFHLGPHWLPAVQNADGSVSPNAGSPPHTDVRILLPQILLRFSLGEDFNSPSFRVAAWGDPGFDAPNDLAEGQLATMDPPLAIHISGRVAFGIQTIILDLSPNGTPPEILQYFGTDESFEGLYIKAIQLYYTDSNKDLALNFAVRDALISFAGKVWLEAELDLIRDEFTVNITAWNGSIQVPVNAGSQLTPVQWHGGSLTLPETGVVYLQIAGGIPPYTQSVTFNSEFGSPPPPGGQQIWDPTQRLAVLPAGSAGDTGSLVVTVTDSTLPTPLKYVNSLKLVVTDPSSSAGAPPAPPAPPSNQKPKALRRLSIRLRLEMNTVVLAEISGEVDWTALMQSFVPGGSPANSSNQLGITGTPAATSAVSPPSVDTIIDFTLNVTYDLATGNLTETVTLGAVPADINGLAHMDNASDTTLKDIFGAILIFTPIVSAATKAIDPGDAGQWADIAIDLGVPVAIGSLDIVRTTGITLFGGSLQLRENIHSGSLTNAAITFDYAVQFGVEIDALGIKTTKPLQVRYRAVGLNLLTFQFVLDTSKGYSLDLSDPGLFHLPGALGDLLKIAGARIARFNPLTLEVDIEIKADLGIVTVDKFAVKVPLDPPGLPMIVPSGVKVNIPQTITGAGTVNISDGGFEGQLDVTICPISLRMVASIGVQRVPDNAPPGTRTATAFYFGFEVDFPSPIILGDTGLSLFGIFGLFGMHYDRLLSAPVPGDAVGPDLRWLMNTKGQPYLIESQNGATQFWTPKLDNWAFGIGVILGTSDGFLLTMRGMFILELPGPRIIITVNLKFIAELPGLETDGMDTTDLDVGIIGILDLDFGAGQITLGAMIDLEIQDLISIQIPVQLYFNWNDPSDWHFWLGTIQTPATAKILGIVKGGGYFMIGGQAIQPFPPNSNTSLPGVAVAMGVSAPVVWGSESADVYLKVAASADFGISFSPKLFIAGDVHLEGSLHLLIVNIGASGDFQITAPHPVYMKVHVCGSISALFFSFSACVDFSIGSAPQSPPAPPPLVSNVYLQSYAPVIAQGQGDSPIDASLGNAVLQGGQNLPVVPIDTVPVIQMLYGVDVSAVTSTFTQSIPHCPTYPGVPGVNLGGGTFAQYRLRSLTINPPLPTNFPNPPVAWRPNKPSGNTSETQVDLALFSRNPNVTTSALERSTQLSGSLTATWSETCTVIAPAACVFWAFCGQRLGPSLTGWILNGIPTPDPPNTWRQTPVATQMQVTQPSLSPADALALSLGLPFAGVGISPARVIGSDLTVFGAKDPCDRAVQLPELIAAKLGSETSSAFTGSESNTVALNPRNKVIAAIASATAGGRWLRFSTGQSQRIRILLAVPAVFVRYLRTQADASWLQIIELDPQSNATPHNLFALNPTVVTSAANLPSTWTAANSPWRTDVSSALNMLHTQSNLTTLFVEFAPRATTTTIEIAVSAPAGIPATVDVGAIESCPTSELIRVNNSEAIQQSTIETITSYLDGGASVPLLRPNTLYTIGVAWDVIDPQNSNPVSSTQSYQFRTDSRPPDTLNSYVLCTSPATGDTCCFYEDPVDIIFNDASVFSLFEAYGYQLTMDLRAADGLPEGSPGTTVLTGSPSPLQSINGIGPATYDSMLGVAKRMPCISGSITSYQNQVFTAPVYLRPLMGYTFDLITIPTVPPLSSSPPAAIQPLFRRNFTTGRYANMQALAQAVLSVSAPGSPASGKSGVGHRALKSALNFTPPAGASMTDDAIQQAFLAAGEQALPAASENTVAMYWVLSTSGHYVPHAILIDTIEPIWRSRPQPTFTTPIPSDPSFQIVTIGSAVSLEVKDASASPAIDHFVVSPGGTRTVAVFRSGFAPPATGATITLNLHRPPSSFYGNPDQSALMLELTVMPFAPWESDHV